MKILLLLAFTFFSLSSFAKECEIELSPAADASSVTLNLREKDKAAPDSEMITSIIGSKREQSDCTELAKRLEVRGLKTVIDEKEVPVNIVNLSEKKPVPLLKDDE